MASGKPGRAFPVEEFLQAIMAQLDRAQDALAAKVSTTRRPLTWGLKDVNLDLRVFIEVNEAGRVMMRSAAPNEDGSSTIQLSFTAVTRPMVEENAFTFDLDSDPRSIDDLGPGLELDDDSRRKLDWMGVRTVGQLKQIDPRMAQAAIGIPAGRLQAALAAAARPTVLGHEVVQRPDGARLLRIRGANLSRGVTPEVHLAGQPVEVLEATAEQILVRPLAAHDEGQVEVFTEGERVTGWFRLPQPATASPGGNGNGNGHGQAAHSAPTAERRS
jgi:hypothetical protein